MSSQAKAAPLANIVAETSAARAVRFIFGASGAKEMDASCKACAERDGSSMGAHRRRTAPTASLVERVVQPPKASYARFVALRRYGPCARLHDPTHVTTENESCAQLSGLTWGCSVWNPSARCSSTRACG